MSQLFYFETWPSDSSCLCGSPELTGACLAFKRQHKLVRIPQFKKNSTTPLRGEGVAVVAPAKSSWKRKIGSSVMYFAIKTNGIDFDWGVEFSWDLRIKPSSQWTGCGTLVALQDGASPILTANILTKCLQVFMPALASLKKRLRSTPCCSTLLKSSDN